ncbi:MAG: hypothetical protein R6W77_16920 [Trueperaceae bacterium]
MRLRLAAAAPSAAADLLVTRAVQAVKIVAVFAVATLVLAACRPLYLPIVPDEVPVALEVRLTDDSTITLTDGRPQLSLVPESVEVPGWLDVQWFAPNGREAASMSVWLEPSAQEGSQAPAARAVVVTLPVDVDLVPGEWRALVSMGGRFLRQFRIDVP